MSGIDGRVWNVGLRAIQMSKGDLRLNDSDISTRCRAPGRSEEASNVSASGSEGGDE
jgi:hypothetical protein